MASRTYVSKPSHTVRSRPASDRGENNPGLTSGNYRPGRGRGRAMAQRPAGTTPEYTANNPEQPSQDQSPASRVQSRGAYTLIVPDDRKRNEILEKARKEEIAYEQHKNQKKLSHVSCVGTPGLGQLDESQVRRKMQQDQDRKKKETWKKINETKQKKKTLEEEEIEKKNLEARKKAEKNKEAEAKRKEKLKEDHRRKNQAFLDRIEQESKQAAASSNIPVDGPTDYDQSPEGAANRQDDVQSSLTELIKMYPDYQPEILCNILDECGGDLEQAINLLSE